MKPTPPKIVKVPERCRKNLTPGKEYSVVGIWDDWMENDGYGFSIIDDEGDKIDVSEKKCPYVFRQDFIIVEREKES